MLMTYVEDNQLALHVSHGLMVNVTCYFFCACYRYICCVFCNAWLDKREFPRYCLRPCMFDSKRSLHLSALFVCVFFLNKGLALAVWVDDTLK